MPTLPNKVQKFLFGGLTLTRSEQFILVEMICDSSYSKKKSNNSGYSIKKSNYREKEFYTTVNRLMRKGIIGYVRDPDDKRKKRYVIIPTDRNIHIVSMLMSGISASIGTENTYFDQYPTRTIDSYFGYGWRKNLRNEHNEMVIRMTDELKHGYSILDELEFSIDRCVPTVYFKEYPTELSRS